MTEKDIIIVGAGISGLIAAYELEKRNLDVLIVEKSDRVGGRVKTDLINGYQLDHGFQVLLTAYPEAQKYLDYASLQLKYFDPGAIIMEAGDHHTILSDPTRKPLKLPSTLLSKAGTLQDKLRIWQLSRKLKNESLEAIFKKPSIHTQDYLQAFGFSDTIIHYFFKPFFGGIFLENELKTSSRMFEFVFKMFSSGHAALPAKGMEEIPKQLKEKLSKTDFLFNYEVVSVNGNEVTLDDGNVLTAKAVVIATQPDKIIQKLKGQFPGYQQVTNLYFTTDQSFVSQPLIGLVPSNELNINNLCFLNDTAPVYASHGKSLLSVSVNGIHSNANGEFSEQIKKELTLLTGIRSDQFQHLKTYQIQRALPIVDDVHFEMYHSETQIFDNIFLAGDYLLNGSLNAAMTSGRNAAIAISDYLANRA